MPEAARTYWLTTACRIRRKDSTLAIEREDGTRVHLPVTDIRDIIATAPVDINTAVITLFNQYGIGVHLLSYYGDYAGSVLPSDAHISGQTVLAQAKAATTPEIALTTAADLVKATAFNVARVIDRTALRKPLSTLEDAVDLAGSTAQLMAAEGNFRRTAWAALDTKLPDWLRLDGRSRRPPTNAGNAFISYVNGIVYARTLTAIRLTPLHSGIAFLHSSLERHRHSLALDLAEVFRPLFAERLLLRLSGRGQLTPDHFDATVGNAMLSEAGRRFVVQTVRDELATTITHRALKRSVAYDELLYLEALKLTRTCLEGERYKPLRIWW
ncbi:CRISPR-associated endonuclease Cas1 [Parafrankia sp. EUN1f]|uniref:CRISPR-associated endonuclease Cas1 n=1 Tax=Parafrankia sp. EUN1f TaxID=102897 RepID=UPI0001C46403|nr:CRISPR-associated endonuclease Cas1 [Parafrankia sp. EUN1f]EFC81109.1 CRISPR-associated protein Cas1 [Parafrankia sp. EUN1f]